MDGLPPKDDDGRPIAMEGQAAAALAASGLATRAEGLAALAEGLAVPAAEADGFAGSGGLSRRHVQCSSPSQNVAAHCSSFYSRVQPSYS